MATAFEILFVMSVAIPPATLFIMLAVVALTRRHARQPELAGHAQAA